MYGLFAMSDEALDQACARAFDLGATATLLRLSEEKARRRAARTVRVEVRDAA